MTREEAIEILKNSTMKDTLSEQWKEAYKMAIKALEQEPIYYPPCIDCNKKMDEIRHAYDKLKEQEPSGDLISRQAVFDLMRSLTRWCVRSEDGKFNNVGLLYDDVMFGIDKLPSVNPQPCDDAIRAEIEQKCDRINSIASVLPYTAHREIQELLCEIMDLVKPQESETWNGYHGQITAPKGTFEKIFNDADDDSDI